VLARTAERSARILAHPGITKLSLPAGPMALSGSTRLQASTVLMAAIGTALLDHARPGRIRARFATLATLWRGLDTSFLAGFTVAEARIYAEGGCLDYVADPALAITLLTDTTERAPTFSFPPFEHARDAAIRTAPCRLAIPEARDAAMAWRMVLGREPRALEWPELRGRASLRHLLGYDFSGAGDETPSPALPFRDRHAFSVSAPPGGLEFRLGALAHRIPLPGADPLAVHLVLKMMLNAHSTLVMGRLGRFDGNLMTWVKPSNHKLVDRTIRYAGLLLLREGVEVPYESLARACFAMRDRIPGDQSLVHAIVNHYKSARSGRRRPRAARRNNAGIPHG
jgi:N-acetylmuramic acid 6-phosphate etherase